MPYRIAGIDVHKKMLAVVVADVEVEKDFQFARQKIGTSPADLRALAEWLVERLRGAIRNWLITVASESLAQPELETRQCATRMLPDAISLSP
jgi:hypothetical protein